MRSVLLGAMALVLSAAVACAAVDEHTTFLAHYDTGALPDYCAGDWSAGVAGSPTLVEGKFGQALELESGKSVSYPAEGKINPEAGTIELWLKWLWEPGTAPKASILLLQTPAGSYLRLNTVVGGKLGMAYSTGTGDAQVWRRVEIQPPVWEPGEWHHMAATWGDGVIRLYIDGILMDEDEGALPLEGKLGDFSLGRGPLVIDELHIASVARSADEIMTSALAEPDEAIVEYLTNREPKSSAQAMGSVGIDAETAVDDRELPLTIGMTGYARGVALRAPARIEYEVPEGVALIAGVAGVSGFAPAGASVALKASVEPVEMDIPIAGPGTIVFEAAGDADAAGVFADIVLLGEGAGMPPAFAREMTEDQMAIQRQRTHVAEYSFDLPENPRGYMFYAGHPVDQVAPDTEPLGEKWPESMLIKAAPGEYEAIQFAIFAAQDMPSVSVSCTDLAGPAQIGSGDLDVRLIRRGLQRAGYWMERKPTTFSVISRFLMPNRDFWLPAGNFKEMQVIVHVPDDAPAGQYTGTVTVGGDPFSFGLNVEVLALELTPLKDRRYGMYYVFTDMMDRPEALEAELADMEAHGCTTMKPAAGVQFEKADDGTITWRLDDIRALLEGLRRHGCFGSLPVYDRIDRLGIIMGHRGIGKDGTGEPLAEQEDLLAICRDAFFELKSLNAEYPEFELVLTHMDEVFNRDRMARYIDIAEVVRKTTDMRIYITHHTQPGSWEKYMAQADPYIDVRSMNGHSLETWLHDGNSFDDMAALLEESGDEAWIYHNMRGAFFEAEWNRIINGIWMWQSPITVHAPWKYYSIGGDPFDDTDADHFDFVYAVPMPGNPTELISTLHYEAFREGIDDMRYIATLEDAITRAEEAGIDASAAKAWLAEMAGMMPQAPEDIVDIDDESPLCVAMSRKFSGADWDRLRWHTAELTIALQQKMQ